MGVRRLRDGEEVIASDGNGAWRQCTLRGGGLEVMSDIVVEALPTTTVTVALAPVKGDRSEWAVAKLTELGVDRIVALRVDRAAVRWDDRAATKSLERWRRVAREAAAQSRRPRLPEIIGLSTLHDLVDTGTVSMAVPGGSAPTLSHPTICVGPEGGWSPEELACDVPSVGLGEQVLRTETAAVAAGVILTGLRGGTVAPMVQERGV